MSHLLPPPPNESALAAAVKASGLGLVVIAVLVGLSFLVGS